MFRRMKRLLRLHNKSGFTMVEVIIASALLGVLVVGIMGFVTPILDGVRVKEQNARAVLLSEAIDTYIANSIQYAYYVATVDCAASGDTLGAAPKVRSSAYQGTEFETGAKGVDELFNRFNTMGSSYEVRCIGVRWIEDDPIAHTKKLMITNEQLAKDAAGNYTGALVDNGWVPVFESVFYDGLYPIVRIENYSNQYQIKDDTGVLVDQVKPEDVGIAPGLNIITDVYLAPDCYNIKDDVREKQLSLTFSGVTYADLPNIRSNLINSDKTFKVQPKVTVNTKDEGGKKVPSYQGAYVSDPTARYTADGETYYYPNSFIYYIARKVKIS